MQCQKKPTQTSPWFWWMRRLENHLCTRLKTNQAVLEKPSEYAKSCSYKKVTTEVNIRWCLGALCADPKAQDFAESQVTSYLKFKYFQNSEYSNQSLVKCNHPCRTRSQRSNHKRNWHKQSIGMSLIIMKHIFWTFLTLSKWKGCQQQPSLTHEQLAAIFIISFKHFWRGEGLVHLGFEVHLERQ